MAVCVCAGEMVVVDCPSGGAGCVFIPWEYSLCGWGGGRYSTVIVQPGSVPGQGGKWEGVSGQVGPIGGRMTMCF